jgi:hypothetical protein
MDGHGQPALLYIVPFTLGNQKLTPPIYIYHLVHGWTRINKIANLFLNSGTLISLGWKRRELRNLWFKGEPERVCTHVHMMMQPHQAKDISVSDPSSS